jgi:uncharacterized protein YbbC (DUF1343 family)
LKVRSGLDVLVNEGMARLMGKRTALLGHPASIDSRYVHLLDACREHGVALTKLFGPEHGLLGDAQDMDHVASHQDERTKLAVVSLYGKTRDSLFLKPAMLDGVDVLVCDLQDIGSRYYTFAYTIAFALRACAERGVRCVVLDRPNPINGTAIEGNVVDRRCASFVGEYPLANRHGLTLGELCRFFAHNDQIAGKLDLDIVWMDGWRRAMWHDETGAPWVYPSPNMPTPDTALVYAGACLFEGTNLSEGRGTTKPFELVGAPYIGDPHRFAALASAQDLPGVVLRPCFFRPTFQKHAGQLCGGLQIHVVDRRRFDSLKTSVAILIAARAFDGFDWRRTTYEYVSDRLAIDLLFGSSEPRALIDGGAQADGVMASFLPARAQFATERGPFLHAGYAP